MLTTRHASLEDILPYADFCCPHPERDAKAYGADNVHTVMQGGGLFVNPTSTTAPAKLRLLYECAPLAFIVEAAGGASSNGMASVLKMTIDSLDRRTAITLGSKSEVARSEHCLHS